MNTFLLMPTMRCQLRCSYCHFRWLRGVGTPSGYTWTGYGRDHLIKSEMKAEELLRDLKPFQPYHVEFSGGEPLLWDGIEEFVKNIPPSSQWAITSNSLVARMRKLDFSRCIAWTASWHGEDKVRFIDNLMAVRERFPHVFVSQVVRKNTIDAVIADAELFASIGFRPNILREYNPGVNWNEGPEWARLVTLRALGWNVVEDDIPPEYRFDRGYLCAAGNRYWCIMPDGAVYRCYSDAMVREPAGTIASIPILKPGDCWESCLGCALDHKVRMKKLEVADAGSA